MLTCFDSIAVLKDGYTCAWFGVVCYHVCSMCVGGDEKLASLHIMDTSSKSIHTMMARLILCYILQEPIRMYLFMVLHSKLMSDSSHQHQILHWYYHCTTTTMMSTLLTFYVDGTIYIAPFYAHNLYTPKDHNDWHTGLVHSSSALRYKDIHWWLKSVQAM